MVAVFAALGDRGECIIVDGGSTDGTIAIATKYDCRIIISEHKGRAIQMNIGALVAENNILYFLHADAIPPINFVDDILRAIHEGNDAGWFSYRFDKKGLLFRINEWFTTMKGPFSGGGDQSLFIKKDIFDQLGGFDESYTIMEDFAMTRKLKKRGYKIKVINNPLSVSARKFSSNSWFRVNLVNGYAFLLFLLKVNPNKIKEHYKVLLNPY